MKLVKKLFAGSVLAAAVMSANASIVIPNTAGGSELWAVLYTIGNQNSLVVDLGTTITNFNTNVGTNTSFNLAASPYYSTFISNNAGASTVQYAVIGANQFGSSKQLWVTAPSNTTPASITNATLATRTGSTNNFVGALNSAPNSATYTNGHSATDGSSLDTTSGTATSFSVMSGNLGNSLTMVDVGTNAELFRYVTSGAATTAAATITDFYTGTETSTNLGGYFSLNQTTGALDYFGEPGAVVNPIPEASEWAMMLSGLAMLGLMVRRRRNNV